MARTGSLDNPRDFFEEVTRPNYEDFLSKPPSFQTAFSLVMSLFNLHEWVFEFNKAEIEQRFSANSKGDFWGKVEVAVPEAKYIRDLSNASKHVRLTIKPSTEMGSIASASIQPSVYGAGPYGAGRYSQANFIVRDGDKQVFLDDCVSKLFGFWEELIDDLYPTA